MEPRLRGGGFRQSDTMTHPSSDRSETQTLNYSVQNARLPLAVYREVAAHLAQVEGVTTELTPQTSKTFEYTESQIGRLTIQISPPTADAQGRVEQILAYYSDRFGAWERQ